MMRFAITIGVEEYDHFPGTRFAHADSTLMRSTLIEKCDYAEHNSLLLNLVPNDKRSPRDVLSAIRSVVSKSAPGDSVLFYFAGHGHCVNGRAFLILPNTVPGEFESTALPLDDVSSELRADQRSCLRIFDACHSGLDVRDGQDKIDPEGFARAITHENYFGWVTLAACTESESSVCDPAIGHGIFTYHLCEYISGLKAGELVYPEIVKIQISDVVFKHSRKLGYSQTPTLNASISGNISLAIRRTEASEELAAQKKTAMADLRSRIGRLHAVTDIITSDHLQNALQMLVNECKSAFEQLNDLKFQVLSGSPISANEIPDAFHEDIVNFARNQSLQPRHAIIRREYEEDDYNPYLGVSSLLSARRRKVVTYHVSQSSDLPVSASVMELQGDKRCLPNVKVLIYIIPLQVTACMLVSAFQCGWPPFDGTADLICHSYQVLKPNDTPDRMKQLGPSAAKRSTDRLRTIVENRVALLERELGS